MSPPPPPPHLLPHFSSPSCLLARPRLMSCHRRNSFPFSSRSLSPSQGCIPADKTHRRGAALIPPSLASSPHTLTQGRAGKKDGEREKEEERRAEDEGRSQPASTRAARRQACRAFELTDDVDNMVMASVKIDLLAHGKSMLPTQQEFYGELTHLGRDAIESRTMKNP